MSHKIAHGCAIVGANGKLYTFKDRVPPEAFSRLDIQQHVRSGYLIELGKAAPAPAGIPGVVTGQGVTTEGKAHSAYNLDPDGLVGMSLDQLNVLVSEKDPTVEPFTDAMEAQVWLSQDYEAPTAE